MVGYTPWHLAPMAHGFSLAQMMGHYEYGIVPVVESYSAVRGIVIGYAPWHLAPMAHCYSLAQMIKHYECGIVLVAGNY